jgi:UDP-N-acetylmuramate: L-alanyl-gamma-D-glutamyl-meso-diaminopimelate ligase
MHVHILGICGTFMGGIALLARALGHQVTGSDANVYPPMSDQLAAAGIPLSEGWAPGALDPAPDCVVIGNALSRGNPLVEHVLARDIPYTSGPAWLAEHVLRGRWVLAVAGTHGKTSTSAMLAWILERAGLDPGFLIGGVPVDFGVSSRLGGGRHFVVEADEYDTAFFDKRSKFVHYRPRTAVLNNLEYDHADIFPDLAAIQRQFHHLVRTVPGDGLILRPAADEALAEVLAMGCWTAVELTGSETGWEARPLSPDGQHFEVLWQGRRAGTVRWELLGRHNVDNAVSAIAAARHAGVSSAAACESLGEFRNVRRRLEPRGAVDGMTVYDDFAHHPTAIRTTLEGLRRHVGSERIVAILEPRSNTMRMGVHQGQIADALAEADLVVLYAPPGLGWDPRAAVAPLAERAQVLGSHEEILDLVVARARPGDHLLLMSNGAFGGLHDRLLAALRRRR